MQYVASFGVVSSRAKHKVAGSLHCKAPASEGIGDLHPKAGQLRRVSRRRGGWSAGLLALCLGHLPQCAVGSDSFVLLLPRGDDIARCRHGGERVQTQALLADLSRQLSIYPFSTAWPDRMNADLRWEAEHNRRCRRGSPSCTTCGIAPARKFPRSVPRPAHRTMPHHPQKKSATR